MPSVSPLQQYVNILQQMKSLIVLTGHFIHVLHLQTAANCFTVNVCSHDNMMFLQQSQGCGNERIISQILLTNSTSSHVFKSCGSEKVSGGGKSRVKTLTGISGYSMWATFHTVEMNCIHCYRFTTYVVLVYKRDNFTPHCQK